MASPHAVLRTPPQSRPICRRRARARRPARSGRSPAPPPSYVAALPGRRRGSGPRHGAAAGHAARRRRQPRARGRHRAAQRRPVSWTSSRPRPRRPTRPPPTPRRSSTRSTPRSARWPAAPSPATSCPLRRADDQRLRRRVPRPGRHPRRDRRPHRRGLAAGRRRRRRGRAGAGRRRRRPRRSAGRRGRRPAGRPERRSPTTRRSTTGSQRRRSSSRSRGARRHGAGGARPRRRAPAAPRSGGRTALAQVGDPYVWAPAVRTRSTAPGLTQYAYSAAGISLPHSSAASRRWAPRSRADQLQPGDLVFFYSPVSHVGMYIGNGQMVHASTSGQPVKVASLDSMGSYSGARRLSADRAHSTAEGR